MPSHVVWLSYDLGIHGDYDGLFKYLDTYGAKECGDGTAAFSYPFKPDCQTEIRKELEQHMEITTSTRIYIVFRTPDGEYIGRFVFGERHRPPWVGYAPTDDDDGDW